MLVQSGSCLVYKLSYGTNPPALAQETHIVSYHPSGLVYIPDIIKSGEAPTWVLSTVPMHPNPLTVQNVMGHRVGFVFSKNRSYAFPKSGESFVAENISSGTTGSAFCVSVD